MSTGTFILLIVACVIVGILIWSAEELDNVQNKDDDKRNF